MAPGAPARPRSGPRLRYDAFNRDRPTEPTRRFGNKILRSWSVDDSNEQRRERDDAKAREFNLRVERVDPARLIVLIGYRLSAALRLHVQPEDLWQEALCHAWRDYADFEDRGPRSFRNWLVRIIENRIHAASEHHAAAKRREPAPTSGPAAAPDNKLPPDTPGPVTTATPSRIAVYRERAAALRKAIDELSNDYREIFVLRSLEELTTAQVAARLGITEAQARYRFGRGFDLVTAALAPLRSGTC